MRSPRLHRDSRKQLVIGLAESEKMGSFGFSQRIEEVDHRNARRIISIGIILL